LQLSEQYNQIATEHNGDSNPATVNLFSLGAAASSMRDRPSRPSQPISAEKRDGALHHSLFEALDQARPLGPHDDLSPALI
jgi:hypothetical protein